MIFFSDGISLENFSKVTINAITSLKSVCFDIYFKSLICVMTLKIIFQDTYTYLPFIHILIIQNWLQLQYCKFVMQNTHTHVKSSNLKSSESNTTSALVVQDLAIQDLYGLPQDLSNN